MDDFIDGGLDFLPSYSGETVFNPWEETGSFEADGSFIGDSEAQGLWREQSTPFTCAVVSQQMILESFGVQVSEAQLVYDSVSNGWLSEGGTSVGDVGALLDYYGIPVHQGAGGDIESLVFELAQGHKVIVGVDSGELWDQDMFFEDWLNPNGADHAIMVNGIDTSDPNNIMVIVNDPGHPDGAGLALPIKDFMDAWQDSGQHYTATSIAPQGLGDMPMLGNNFNPDTGWFFDQNFWEGVLQGITTGVKAGVIAYNFTGDEDFSEMSAAVAGGIATFVNIVGYFDSADVDNAFYSI